VLPFSSESTAFSVTELEKKNGETNKWKGPKGNGEQAMGFLSFLKCSKVEISGDKSTKRQRR